MPTAAAGSSMGKPVKCQVTIVKRMTRTATKRQVEIIHSVTVLVTVPILKFANYSSIVELQGLAFEGSCNRQEEAAVPFLAVGSGQSRLGSEFSFISDLGKGGFGEVMKVKNNLDGQG